MIKIGETINLEPVINPNGEKYKCRVVEKTDDKLYIDYPVNKKTGKTVYLMNGMQLNAFFLGEGTSVYFFETTVLGRIKDGIPMIVLSYPSSDALFKIQRRQFVRIETPVDVALHSKNGEYKPFVSITHDISAGGASVILPYHSSLVPETEVRTVFVLPTLSDEYIYVTLISKVIRIVEGRNGERNKVSLQFANVTENDRQLLIKFCFERQLLLKKKGIHSHE
ncbi:flagellar brake protein [Fredinandcohnia humi]